jgi:hypothetical protein
MKTQEMHFQENFSCWKNGDCHFQDSAPSFSEDNMLTELVKIPKLHFQNGLSCHNILKFSTDFQINYMHLRIFEFVSTDEHFGIHIL